MDQRIDIDGMSLPAIVDELMRRRHAGAHAGAAAADAPADEAAERRRLTTALRANHALRQLLSRSINLNLAIAAMEPPYRLDLATATLSGLYQLAEAVVRKHSLRPLERTHPR